MTQSKHAHKKHSTKIVIIILSVVVLVGGVIAYALMTGYIPFKLAEENTEPAAQTLTEKTQVVRNSSNVQKLLEESSEAAGEASKQTFASNVEQWGDEDIDRAYYAMVYADKIGNFTEVLNIDAKLQGAVMLGKNVTGQRVNVSDEQRQQYVTTALNRKNGTQ
jgi:cytoskeletal protein RodZ